MSTLKNSHAYNATNLLAVRHMSVVPQHSFIHLHICEHSIVKLPNALMLSNWCCLGPAEQLPASLLTFWASTTGRFCLMSWRPTAFQFVYSACRLGVLWQTVLAPTFLQHLAEVLRFYFIPRNEWLALKWERLSVLSWKQSPYRSPFPTLAGDALQWNSTWCLKTGSQRLW